jgi:hypothetical protein
VTIDERLEFLVPYTESLHASCQELHAIVAAHTQQITEHTRQLEIDAQNIRALATIAGDHDERLDDLENN